jgi:hypothetical protein|eukprot:COSAG01_NODE_4927_length_4613_cov_1.410671_2_plen_97_part_00
MRASDHPAPAPAPAPGRPAPFSDSTTVQTTLLTQELAAAIYLCTDEIAPSYTPTPKATVGYATIARAVQSVTGADMRRLKERAAKLGDLGDAAMGV